MHHVLLCLLAVPHVFQPVSCTHSRARSCQVSVNAAGTRQVETQGKPQRSTFATGRRAPCCALTCFVRVWFPNPWAARVPRGCSWAAPVRGTQPAALPRLDWVVQSINSVLGATAGAQAAPLTHRPTRPSQQALAGPCGSAWGIDSSALKCAARDGAGRRTACRRRRLAPTRRPTQLARCCCLRCRPRLRGSPLTLLRVAWKRGHE